VELVVSSLAPGRVRRRRYPDLAAALRAADRYRPCASRPSRGIGFRCEIYTLCGQADVATAPFEE
jgi:hypothetical protein